MSLDRKQLEIIAKGTFPFVDGMKRLQIDSISPEIKAQDIFTAFEKSSSPNNRLGMLVFGNLSITDAAKLLPLCKSKMIEHVSLCFAETPKEAINILMQAFQRKANLFELHLGKLNLEAIEAICGRLQETTFSNIYLDFFNGHKNSENRQILITIATLLAPLSNKNNISIIYPAKPNGTPTFVRFDKFIKENLPVNFSQDAFNGASGQEAKQSQKKRKSFSEEEEVLEPSKFQRTTHTIDAPAAREASDSNATTSSNSSNNGQPISQLPLTQPAMAMQMNNGESISQLPQTQPVMAMQINSPFLQDQSQGMPFPPPILHGFPGYPTINNSGFQLPQMPIPSLEQPVAILPVPIQETVSGDSDKSGNSSSPLELKQIMHKKEKYKKQLEQKHQELRKALAELFPLKKDNKILKYANEKLQQQATAREEAFNKLKAELNQLKSKPDKSKNNSNNMAQRLAETLGQKSELEEQLHQAKLELANNKQQPSQISQLQEELDNYKTQLNNANQALFQTRQEFAKHKSQSQKQLKAEVTVVTQKLTESMDQLTKNKVQLSNALKELQESQRMLSSLTQEAMADKLQLRTTQSELNQCKKLLASKDQELLTSKQRFDRDQKEIAQLKEQLRIAAEKQSQTSKHLQEANAELTKLKSGFVRSQSNAGSVFFSRSAPQMRMHPATLALEEDEDPMTMNELSQHGKSS